MKNLRIILLLLVSATSFAQSFEMYKGDTVNRKDAQDQRQGHWVVLNKANSNPGYASKINPVLRPIYSYYTIDPDNRLSGNTPCAIQKYVNYMILNTNAFIDVGCPPDNFIQDCFCQP